MKNYLAAAVVLAFTVCHGQTNMQMGQPVGFWLARSAGKFTQLSYSLGHDRLGSAKMGYIDTAVLLKVVDSSDNLYHVQLSKYHTAWVFKQDVVRDSVTRLKPFYLAVNFSEKPADVDYDSLFIQMDERLPYKSWMEVDPSRIMIDLYGVESNTNWITQLSSIKEIKNVFFNQVEDDVVQITIELKHAQEWGYTIFYKGNHLAIAVKRQPVVLNIKKLKIAIDAGHGGTNVGAEGVASHITEKKYTLIFAKLLQNYLKAQGVANVIMTRTTDTTFNNTDRVLWLQQQHPDLLVSLHLNDGGNYSTRGSSTYYRDVGFRPLSVALLKQMLAIGMDEYGNTGNFNFLLNQPTDFPSALLEIAFLSNRADERKVLSSKFRQLVAKQVYTGIVDFLNNAKEGG